MLNFLAPLYCAPEMLKNREQNRRRRMDQKWIAQSSSRRQAGDIYAFGMVMYEILFRAMPYPQCTDISGTLRIARAVTVPTCKVDRQTPAYKFLVAA